MEKANTNDNSPLNEISSIHVFGAGLNKERTAWHSIGKLSQRGFRVIPIHIRDAGATISVPDSFSPSVSFSPSTSDS